MPEPGEAYGDDTGGRRGRLVAVAAILIVSLLPWYRVTTGYHSIYAGSGVRVNSANVWLASTWWSAALVLTAVAVVLYHRGSRPAVRGGDRWRWLLTVLSVVAFAALAVQWWGMVAPTGPGTLTIESASPQQLTHPDLSAKAIAPIDRNALHWDSDSTSGYRSGPTPVADVASLLLASSCLWFIWSARPTRAGCSQER